MEIAIMILTFICAYAFVAFVLFVVARAIFPSVDDLDVKQFKPRHSMKHQRQSRATAIPA